MKMLRLMSDNILKDKVIMKMHEVSRDNKIEDKMGEIV